MTRTINVTSTATPAAGKTISSTTYRLLAADGVTVISTAAPPYVGVTDAALKLEQTVTQSDAQVAVITRDIPGRVTNLAATNAAAPVLTWTDVGGEASYEIHRGAAGFTPDISGGTTRIGLAVANAITFTDSSVAGNGSTVYAYRLVAMTSNGYTIGNEATCTPAATTGGGTTRTDNFNRADNAAAIGAPSDGGSAWIVKVGHYGINGNKAYPVVGDSGGIAAPFSSSMELCVSTLALSANGTLSVDLNTSSGSNGLIFRIQDNSNYWLALNNGNYIYLFKIVAGVASTIISDQLSGNYPLTDGFTFTVVLTAGGFQIKTTQAGVTVVEYTSVDTAFAAATEHGMASSNVTIPTFDNFSFVGT